MLEYQKKVGRKHRISPRNERTRSQQKKETDSVLDNEVNKAVTIAMAAEDPDLADMRNLMPIERLEKMMNGMCQAMKEVQGQMSSMQKDVSQIKKLQTVHYEDLGRKLADCQRENADLKNQVKAAEDRIDTLEQCYGRTYTLREKDRKDKKALNLIIRGVPECDRERIYETMNDLLAPLQGEITYTQTNGASRMGAKPTNQQIG